MSIYDKASLVLIPSGTKTSKVYSQKPVNGDGDFTFSRSTAATRVNADGNIEKETQNLLLRSNKFDTTWTKSSATIASGQSGYDGSNNAWNFTTSAAGASLEQSVTTAGVVVFSLYAKANGINGVRLRIDAATDANGYFNLSTGAVHSFAGSAINASITSVGGGWYRCEVAANISSPVKVAIYTTDGTTSYDNGSILIQDSQLEQGLVARDYIETTTAAVEGGITDNVPRLDYTDSSCPALLLEPQRSNLVTQSEYIDSWGKSISNGTLNVTSNYGISPDGSKNATRIQASLTGGFVDMVKVISVSSGSAYTYSVYLKSLSGTPTIAFLSDGTANRLVTLTTEWKRYTFKISSAGSLAYPRFLLENNVTSSSADYLAWGAQLEAGSYETSYIPTYGSSVTRTGELCNNAGSASTFNDSEGVLYAEIKALNETGGNRYISLSDGTDSNRVILRFQDTDKVGCYVRSASGTDADITKTSASISSNFLKVAVKWKTNDVALWVNGVEVGTDSSFTTFNANVLDELNLTGTNGTSQYFHGNAKQVIVFNEALTDSELATLTTL